MVGSSRLECAAHALDQLGLTCAPSLKELHTVECHSLPGSGTCAAMFTACTMASVVEALGMSLPGSASTPAATREDPRSVTDQKRQDCAATVAALFSLAEKGLILPVRCLSHAFEVCGFLTCTGLEEELCQAGKFIKAGRVVVMLQGRYAGKKMEAIVVKTCDDGSKSRPFGHCLVAGIDRAPLKVTRKMSKKKITKRTKVKTWPFTKYVNYNHIMPTRYNVPAEISPSTICTDAQMDTPDGLFQEKFQAPPQDKSGRPSKDVLYLRKKLSARKIICKEALENAVAIVYAPFLANAPPVRGRLLMSGWVVVPALQEPPGVIPICSARSEHWASTSAARMNINRADNRYGGAGENWYYRAMPGQAATEMHYATCGMMSTTTPTSELVLMHDAFGGAERMNINRADNRYGGAGENWYYRAMPGQAATEMHYVTCGMMSTTTPTSELVLMHDAFGWAERPPGVIPICSARSEHWASTSAARMNINRADNRYGGAGENWYYRAMPGQAATEMHYVTCGMMSTTTPTSELVLMHDAFGWAERPGFMNVPAAAPVSPLPPSNDVKNIMANMALLRGMGPEQAGLSSEEFNIEDIHRVGQKVPLLGNLSPHGRYHMSDLDKIGGVPVVLRELMDAGLLHGHCMTVTGRTMAENLAGIPSVAALGVQDVLFPVSKPLAPKGNHILVLKGNLAESAAVEAATPKVDISEIDNAMQCSEQETQETQSNADKGMNDRSSESEDSDSRPPVRISKILTLKSTELMRGISIKETLRSWGHLWRQSPIDLPEKEPL
ncbi:60S ribosomal protein L27 [Symbiodinium microadriaticum]|uniref:60S ribosomal protein L27 n=1 Tax=Symbiodinium microadriaticum TaxID=2951 RepID=A0A1Q9DGY5_SYMMI|nr:60S ribosomal protein L27 [Symbiodinium microadriaticum]